LDICGVTPKNYFPYLAQLRGEGLFAIPHRQSRIGVVIEAGNGVLELPLLLAGGKELIWNSS
jgi:hypothetical protein